ncbi:HAD family hydrolase [Solicola sp. PLA-1-18]|uniref:HAD family hydrolase n=1 Tax=Solicola sp. PLA-1-18 TaxID=3380532 RepID=UPI003B7F760A
MRTDGLPAAVLWDLDGTIVDTEPIWIAAEFDLARRHGAEWSDDDAMQLVGNDLLESGRYIKKRMDLDLEPEEIVADLIAAVLRHMESGDLQWRPGALELLAQLRSAGVLLGLVTMSWRSIVESLLPHLPEDVFDVVMTGDEVSAGKPDPEPYLAAARALGVDPRDCVAVEDSPTGARSAQAAGCHVLAVPHHVPVGEEDRRTVRQSLVGLTPQDLGRLL